MATTYNLDLKQAISLFTGAEEELVKQIKEQLMVHAEKVVEEAAKEMAKALQIKFETSYSIQRDAVVLQLSVRDKAVIENLK